MAKILAVLAREHDTAVFSSLSRIWPGEILQISCKDLSTPGWHHRVHNPAEGCLVAGGKSVPVGAIGGLVVRIGWIVERDIPWVVEGDRPYMASEMNAFLMAFLHALPCRVANAPSNACLAGPSWRQAQWTHQAMSVGLNIHESAMRFPMIWSEGLTGIDVVVIGDRWFGPVDESVGRKSAQLAASAGVDMLVLHFVDSPEGQAFQFAHPWPDISEPQVGEAVCELFA